MTDDAALLPLQDYKRCSLSVDFNPPACFVETLLIFIKDFFRHEYSSQFRLTSSQSVTESRFFFLTSLVSFKAVHRFKLNDNSNSIKISVQFTSLFSLLLLH